MTLFTRSLWPERVRHPYLRLVLAMVAAPLLLAAVLSLVAFLVAGSSEFTREGTMAVTREAAITFFVVLPAFTLTAGLVGVAVLWALARRGISSWAFVGSCTGGGAAAGSGVIAGQLMPVQIAIAVVIGAVIFVLIRLIAGIRIS